VGTPVVKIRLYRESDEEAVSEIWNDAFSIEAPHHQPKASIQRKLAVDPDLFFVATVDSSVVGTVMGGYDGHRGWIYALAVRPEHRHRGIGRALMARVEEELIKRDCPKVNLQVLTSNSVVIDFYERIGYQVEERISMGKKLYQR
jgi:ribosomal protein S18 acetylase RimI-like enzyme